MARITRAASHLPVEEVKARMENDPQVGVPTFLPPKIPAKDARR